MDLCKTGDRNNLILDIKEILETFMSADIELLASKCRFPDWLGYMGLVLYEFSGEDESIKALHQKWSSKLLNIVPTDHPIHEALKEISIGRSRLTLGTLERCERSIIAARFKLYRHKK